MQLSAKPHIVVILLLPPFVKPANSCFKPGDFFAMFARCFLCFLSPSDKLQDCRCEKHCKSAGGDNKDVQQFVYVHIISLLVVIVCSSSHIPS